MSDCNVCNKPISSTRKISSIVCTECKQMCHGSCVNMTKDDVECIVSQNQVWCCPPCVKSKRSNVSSHLDTNIPDIYQIIKMLKEASDDRKRMETNMNNAFEFAHKQIEDQMNILNDQNKKISGFVKMIEDLQTENSNLKKRVKELESRIDDNEQYARSNTLEIHNIPELPNEDTYEIVTKVGTALNMEISRDMVDICHRLGKRPESDRPAAIIVKFVRREVKQTLLNKRRERKNNFTTKDVGYQISSGHKIVYVNESLCPGRKKVYAAAREAKKNKGFKYLWIRNGRILMRQDDNAPVKALTSIEDVHSL